MQKGELSATTSALFLAVIAGVSQIFGFCYRVALSRLVGAEVMGLYQLLMPVFAVLLSLTAVGMTSAVSNLTPQYLARNNTRAVRQTLHRAIVFFLVCLVPVGAVVVIFYDPISVYFLGDARTQLGLVLLLPCVALTGIENIHKHFFYGAGLVRPPAIADLFEQVIRAAAVLGILLFIPPLYPEMAAGEIITGMVICEIFSAVTLTVLCRLRLGKMGLQGPGEQSGVLHGRILSLALPAMLTSLLGNVMGAANAAILPQMLVSFGLDRSEAMAEFGVVCGMTAPMLALPTVLLGAINLVLLPRLNRSCALGRYDEIRRRVRRAMQAISVTMLPAMGLLVIIGGDLGNLLFKQSTTGLYILPLAIATAFTCYEATLHVCLNSIGKQAIAAFVSILSGGAQLLVTIIAVPKFGMTGFIAGVLVDDIIGAFIIGALVVRYTKLKFEFFNWLTAPALATLLMALTSNLLYMHLRDAGLATLPTILATAMFGAIIYIAALQAQGVYLREIFPLKHLK